MCESDEQYVPLNDGYNWKGDPNATLSVRASRRTHPVHIRRSRRAPRRRSPRCPTTPRPENYIGPDGRNYTQGDLANPGNKTWQQMLVPPAG